jgi:hypothetical protein
LEQRRSHQPPMLAHGSLLSSRLISPEGLQLSFLSAFAQFCTASLQPYHSPQLKATKNGYYEGGRREEAAWRCG